MGGGRGGMLIGSGRRCAVCLLLALRGSCSVCCGMYGAPERRAVIVGGGDCLGRLMKAVPRVPRGGIVCCCLQRWSASGLTGMTDRLSLTARNVVVLRLCSPSQRRTQQSTDLSHRPIGVVGCARLWHALAGAVGRFSVVIIWLSGHIESIVVALWLTLLPDDGSRGRFGDGGVSVAMSVGPEAEGAARPSAGVCSMLNQK
eukprot:scaffold7738_cov107-Isochrysis_galbana.AAC.10